MAMDFAQQQRNPTRHLVGISAVVILHILVVWALVSGLARKVVEVVKGPIEVKVIEEIIKKPPPPPEALPPPPKVQAPPPPFIPPPEINIAPPPSPAPTITAVTKDAPPGPQAPVIAKVPESAPDRCSRRSQRAGGLRELPGGDVRHSVPARSAEGRDRGRRRDRVHRRRQRSDQGCGDQVFVESRVQSRGDGRGQPVVVPVRGAGDPRTGAFEFQATLILGRSWPNRRHRATHCRSALVSSSTRR